MFEILEKIVSVLTSDLTLTALVPAAQIFVGPVDITEETAASLQLPQINVHIISESYRTVPLNSRDTMIQVDIWSRNNMLEIVNIYEQILVDLNYLSTDQSTAHIFWERLSGSADQYESDRRIWHRSMTFVAWSQKP